MTSVLSSRPGISIQGKETLESPDVSAMTFRLPRGQRRWEEPFY